MSRLNVRRTRGVVIQRFTQLPYAVFQDGVTDERVRPDGIKHLLLTNQVSRIFDQEFENSKSLWAQGNGKRVVPQALIGEIEAEFPERDVFFGLHHRPEHCGRTPNKLPAYSNRLDN